MEEFKKALLEFKNHDEESVRILATAIEKLLPELTDMSKDEAIELLNDVIDFAELDNTADTIDRKIATEKAFNTIKLLVTSLPF